MPRRVVASRSCLPPIASAGELPCRAVARPASAACARPRGRWKKRRARELFVLPGIGRFPSPACCRERGASCESLSWILEPLRLQGYAAIALDEGECTLVDGLVARSREFFGRESSYKEGFKFFPVPGGYLTPYPGTYELFEFRRGLASCPQELAEAGLAAFQALEHLAKRVVAEIDRDVGTNLCSALSADSPTLRCIHYDRPRESVGDGDAPCKPETPPMPGTRVRVVGLSGEAASLNGLRSTVVSADAKGATVTVDGAPGAATTVLGGRRRFWLPFEHLRLLFADVPGTYPAHTDSSLVTVAPRSSILGLEAKDPTTGAWFDIESRLRPGECLVFVGDPLDYATRHRYPALMHRPAVPCQALGSPAAIAEPRIASPFFLYPRNSAVLAPQGLPSLTFDDLNGNVNNCRDEFPWKKRSCYCSDLVYSGPETSAK